MLINTKYEVKVKFHNDFLVVNGNKITVGLTSKPEKGKANVELIKKISKRFNVSPPQVRIIAGAKSRSKIIEILENTDRDSNS